MDKYINTHSGTFHADEIFACACLLILYGDIKIQRSNQLDPDAAFNLDIGGHFNPDKGYFDHHQEDFQQFHQIEENYTIPMSSFGLVWQFYGKETIRKVAKSVSYSIDDKSLQHIYRLLKEKIVIPIDAHDNGIKPHEVRGHFGYCTVSNIIATLNPPYFEENKQESFQNAIQISKQILHSFIRQEIARFSAKDKVLAAYNQTQDGVMELPTFMPWKPVVMEVDEQELVKFVISPSLRGGYQAEAVPVKDKFFQNRIDFPETWGGLQGKDLQVASGVSDAIFCHKNLFIAVAKSREGAKSLVQITLDKVSQMKG